MAKNEQRETPAAGDSVEDGHPSRAAGGSTAGGDGPVDAEYRMAELAEKAGVPVRTVRFYRERKLIPPPRREGRVAWYNEHHLARLRTISALLERGHTLGGIAELLTAFENGHGVRELLGLGGKVPVPWPEEVPVRLTPEALADYFAGEVTAENLATSLDIGYIGIDGDEIVHVSRRLLDASSALVDAGIPLSAVLAVGREVRGFADALAESFATLFRTHVLSPAVADSTDGDPPLMDEAARATENLRRLRGIAKNVVDAELSLAVDRRVRGELESWLRAVTETGGDQPAGPASDDDEPAGPPSDSGQRS